MLSSLGLTRSKSRPKVRLKKRTKRKLVRAGLVSANVMLLAVASAFVLYSPKPSSNAKVMLASEEVATNPLDQLSSADIAVHVAQLADLYEKQSVVNNADTVNAQLSIVPADDKVIAKPQLVKTDATSGDDIKKHTVAANETVTKIAEEYGVTSDSIRWSNGLYSDYVTTGTELLIPPVNGIIYTVQAGDTPRSLAQKYSSDESRLISFNDAEITGLKEGMQIVIPGAVQPVTAAYTATGNSTVYSSGSFAWGSGPVYNSVGGNGYDYGYCTWFAAVRRAQVGRPIPSNLGNASTWRVLSERAGLAVGSTPAKHAVIWHPPTDYYGHVGFVEEVYPDGSIRVSDMNMAGWNVVSERTLSAAQAAGYSYIY